MQLTLSKVGVSYDGPGAHPSSWALKNVSLDVLQGDFLGIAGPTGSGKSTLLQLMSGLIQPTAGRITSEGKSLTEKKRLRSLRGRIGIALQYPERQLFANSVLEDVSFGPKNMGLSAHQAASQAREALAMVGLNPKEVEKLSPFALSGGEQRRVALAGILAMDPEILVLDEPTAGLDPASHRSTINLVANLNHQGLTVVTASHDMDDLAECCSRIAVLDRGRLVLEGAPGQVFSHQQELESIGLALPFAQRFANELKAAGVRLPRGFYPTAKHLADDLSRL